MLKRRYYSIVLVGKPDLKGIIMENSGAELYAQYNWYKNTFPAVIQNAADEFFLPGFQFGLMGISKNINPLMEKDSYFVTKVRIDKQHDMFFRSSQKAVSIILDKTLGKSVKKFDLNRMTDLEAKVITAFNDFLYSAVVKFFVKPQPTLKRTDFDMVHMTYFIKDIEENTSARFIVSLPEVLLNPDTVVPTGKYFSYDNFLQNTLDVNIKIGTTKFSLFELKTLDIGDIVVFEDSNLEKMYLKVSDYEKDIKLKPDLGLLMPVDKNGEEDMSDNNNVNLWDSIEVEMSAQFDGVKITLGDLKKIEEGMVVDLTSIYDNKVTLTVEDKPIARGELVIVNDRYGVKVDEVVAKTPEKSIEEESLSEQNTDIEEQQIENEEGNQEPVQNAGSTEDEDDEFDYSDFELEDDI